MTYDVMIDRIKGLNITIAFILGLIAREKKLEEAGVKFNMAGVEVQKAPEIMAPVVVMEDDYEIQNIEWLNIEEFSEKRAEEKIHEFIKVEILITASCSCNS